MGPFRLKRLGLLLLAALIALAPSARAEEILNSLTKTAPYDYDYTQWLGTSPPAGYGYALYLLESYPEIGISRLYYEHHHRSDWPWPYALHTAYVTSYLGSDEFFCSRTGYYTVEASYTLNGMAGIHVPQDQWTFGGADAMVRVDVSLRIINIYMPIFPVQVYIYTHPVFYRYSTYTWEEPTYWENETFDIHQEGILLEAGSPYRVNVEVRADLAVSTTGGTAGGYAMACFAPVSGTFGPFPYDVSGYSLVHYVRLIDQNPDLDAPVTTLTCPSPPCSIRCAGTTVNLTADDVPGGWGMGETYWRQGDGPLHTDTGMIFFYETDTFEYWSVDRVGNEESPHHKLFIEVIKPPDAPSHTGVPDGTGELWQPVPLEWTASDGAYEYRLQVDDDSLFSSPDVDSTPAATSLDIDGIATSTTFYWRVAAHRDQCDQWSAWSEPWSFTTDITTDAEETPAAYSLAQNYPNPFNPLTTIRFSIPRGEQVKVDVFAVDGKKVITLLSERMEAGNHVLTWDGRDSAGRQVASGVYFYRLRAGAFTETKRMVLLR